MAEPAPLPPLVENLHAPEMFATEVSYFSNRGTMVTLTFTSTRFDNSVAPGEAVRVVIGRLVLPAAGAQALAAGLFDYLQKSGLAPALTPPDPTAVN